MDIGGVLQNRRCFDILCMGEWWRFNSNDTFCFRRFTLSLGLARRLEGGQRKQHRKCFDVLVRIALWGVWQREK